MAISTDAAQCSGRLAIAAARVHERRVLFDQRAEPIEHAEMRRGKDVDDGAALDERGRLAPVSILRAGQIRQPTTCFSG